MPSARRAPFRRSGCRRRTRLRSPARSACSRRSRPPRRSRDPRWRHRGRSRRSRRRCAATPCSGRTRPAPCSRASPGTMGALKEMHPDSPNARPEHRQRRELRGRPRHHVESGRARPGPERDRRAGKMPRPTTSASRDAGRGGSTRRRARHSRRAYQEQPDPRESALPGPGIVRRRHVRHGDVRRGRAGRRRVEPERRGKRGEMAADPDHFGHEEGGAEVDREEPASTLAPGRRQCAVARERQHECADEGRGEKDDENAGEGREGAPIGLHAPGRGVRTFTTRRPGRAERRRNPCPRRRWSCRPRGSSTPGR